MFIYLAVLLSWIPPSKTKLLKEGKFSNIYKRLKIKGKIHAKVTGGKKIIIKSQPFKNYTLFIRPRKVLLKAPTCKELPIWFVPLTPSKFSRINHVQESHFMLAEVEGFFSFEMDSKPFEFNRSLCNYLGIRFR